MSDSEEVDALAKALFHKQDATGIWGAVDEMVRLHFRRQAQQKLTAERGYKEIAKNV